MKVIDAKNVKELLTSLAIVPNVITEKWLNEHTVKAIPIEWIDTYCTDSDIGLRDNDPVAIKKLLEDWRKENE